VEYPHPDPAAVAALLRRELALVDRDRRTRQALIFALEDYACRLRLQNMVAGELAGRLRRMAANCDADADRLARQRRERITMSRTTREAA
jgi:hypothetical protein